MVGSCSLGLFKTSCRNQQFSTVRGPSSLSVAFCGIIMIHMCGSVAPHDIIKTNGQSWLNPPCVFFADSVHFQRLDCALQPCFSQG